MKTVILNIPLFKYKTGMVELEEGMRFMKFIPSSLGNSLTLFCIRKNDNLVNAYFIQDSDSNFMVDLHEYKSFWFERASSLGGSYTIHVQFSDSEIPPSPFRGGEGAEV